MNDALLSRDIFENYGEGRETISIEIYVVVQIGTKNSAWGAGVFLGALCIVMILAPR